MRAKISAADEEIGKKLFLKTEGKKQKQAKKGKKRQEESEYDDEIDYDAD